MALYKAYNVNSGRVVGVIGRVADPVRLTAVATENSSAAITFASTALLFPGMLIKGKGIPVGATVLSVDSATTATLSANATADGTELFAWAYGHNPVAQTVEYAQGSYRDVWDWYTDVRVQDIGGVNAAGELRMSGTAVAVHAPVVSDVGSSGSVPLIVGGTLDLTQSDDVAHEPPRELTEKWSVVSFILVDGQEILLPALPTIRYAPDDEDEAE